MMKSRNFGLDLIRAIAILMVLFAHLGISSNYTGGIFIGGQGVEIFFVLSGFLIGGILCRDFSKGGVTGPVILNFWIRRWFRTLPAYYLVLLLKFVFIDHSLGWKVIVYFLFLQNNVVGIQFFDVSWSLVIEEWFYITLPLFCFILFFRKPFCLNRLFFYLIIFILFENFLRMGWVLKTDRPFQSINGNYPFRIDSMMYGVALSILKIQFTPWYDKISHKKFFLIALIAYAILLFLFGIANSIPNNINTLLWTRTIWFSLNSLGIALLIPFVEKSFQPKQNSDKMNFFYRIVTFISLVSYAAYLLHPFVYQYIKSASVFTTKWVIEVFLCLSITFFLSAIMFRFFERPMMNLRDKVNIRKADKSH